MISVVGKENFNSDFVFFIFVMTIRLFSIEKEGSEKHECVKDKVRERESGKYCLLV